MLNSAPATATFTGKLDDAATLFRNGGAIVADIPTVVKADPIDLGSGMLGHGGVAGLVILGLIGSFALSQAALDYARSNDAHKPKDILPKAILSTKLALEEKTKRDKKLTMDWLDFGMDRLAFTSVLYWDVSVIAALAGSAAFDLATTGGALSACLVLDGLITLGTHSYQQHQERLMAIQRIEKKFQADLDVLKNLEQPQITKILKPSTDVAVDAVTFFKQVMQEEPTELRLSASTLQILLKNLSTNDPIRQSLEKTFSALLVSPAPAPASASLTRNPSETTLPTTQEDTDTTEAAGAECAPLLPKGDSQTSLQEPTPATVQPNSEAFKLLRYRAVEVLKEKISAHADSTTTPPTSPTSPCSLKPDGILTTEEVFTESHIIRATTFQAMRGLSLGIIAGFGLACALGISATPVGAAIMLGTGLVYAAVKGFQYYRKAQLDKKKYSENYTVLQAKTIELTDLTKKLTGTDEAHSDVDAEPTPKNDEPVEVLDDSDSDSTISLSTDDSLRIDTPAILRAQDSTQPEATEKADAPTITKDTPEKPPKTSILSTAGNATTTIIAASSGFSAGRNFFQAITTTIGNVLSSGLNLGLLCGSGVLMAVGYLIGSRSNKHINDNTQKLANALVTTEDALETTKLRCSLVFLTPPPSTANQTPSPTDAAA